jgi:hypothetical protein
MLVPNPPPGMMGQRDAFIHGHSAYRHERQNISRANSRVNAGMSAQIDQFFRHPDSLDGRVTTSGPPMNVITDRL